MSGRSDREPGDRRDVPPICASVDKVIEQSAPALRARGERKRFRNIRSLVSYQAASAMKEHLRRLSYLWSTANSGDDDPALRRASRNRVLKCIECERRDIDCLERAAWTGSHRNGGAH